MKAKSSDGEGFTEVSFPEGDEFALHSVMCNVCEICVGGGFSGPGLPEKKISPYQICPRCGGKDLRIEQESSEMADELRKRASDS